jgi:hypothetical protein
MYSEYFQTFCVLAHRDLRLITATIKGRLVDGCIIVFLQTLAIGQFLPLLGMPISMIAPVYIGTITQLIFSTSFAVAFRHVYDIEKVRFFRYQMSLPLPKTLLFAEYIFSFMLEIFSILIPVFCLGTLLLGTSFPLDQMRVLPSIGMFVLMVFFYALLFIYFAFSLNYFWFLDNVWVRRIGPMFLLGCTFFTWKQANGFSPFFAKLFLVCPVTYVHEGMRAALLGQSNYLPLWICVTVILSCCAALIFLLQRAIKRRLDPI